MNKSALIACFLFCASYAERVTYWNLGISINQERQIMVQNRIDLDSFLVEQAPYSKRTNSGNLAYTLETNYMIEPKIFGDEEKPEFDNFADKNIKELIVNGEYFEAAKRIVKLSEESINQEFYDMNEYYYWSSFVYYHLDSHEQAISQISQIENKDSAPETLFLEALILQRLGQTEKATLLFEAIIEDYPNNDYSNYSKNILKEI